MDLSNDKLNVKITSIIFVLLSIVEFIVFHAFGSVTSWLYLVVTIVLGVLANFKTSEKNHFFVILAVIANHLFFAITIMVSFSELPIAFNNTSQIIFTVGMNVLWLCLYLYVMYHNNYQDAKYVFYIVTVVLIIFKSFSNSVRLVAVVRGYLPGALSVFGGILIVSLIILLTLSQFAFLFAYLFKVNHELDLKFSRIRFKKN